MKEPSLTPFLASLLLLLGATVLAQTATNPLVSENGHFNVSYASQLDPIAINQIHSWTLHITDSEGAPVANADIAIKGGMPQHNHGLATQPTIESSGEGTYLLQGLRFHMMGYWELELTIDYGSAKDTVMIPLEL